MEQTKYRVGLIHATMNSVQPILKAFSDSAPHITLKNFMDESLIFELNETGIVTKDMKRRLLNLVEKAVKSEVDGVLLTCSSFTPVVAEISHLFDVPILSADLSMLEKAVDMGSQIGVIATVEAAGPTTTRLLEGVAKERNKNVRIDTKVITEAFQALQNGERHKHDELIQKEIRMLSDDCDVIILAQFSMARALETLGTASKPVLTSPEISVKAIVDKVSKVELAK